MTSVIQRQLCGLPCREPGSCELVELFFDAVEDAPSLEVLLELWDDRDRLEAVQRAYWGELLLPGEPYPTPDESWAHHRPADSNSDVKAVLSWLPYSPLAYLDSVVAEMRGWAAEVARVLGISDAQASAMKFGAVRQACERRIAELSKPKHGLSDSALDAEAASFVDLGDRAARALQLRANSPRATAFREAARQKMDSGSVFGTEYSDDGGEVRANRSTGIFYLPEDSGYRAIPAEALVTFASVTAAKRLGYRRTATYSSLDRHLWLLLALLIVLVIFGAARQYAPELTRVMMVGVIGAGVCIWWLGSIFHGTVNVDAWVATLDDPNQRIFRRFRRLEKARSFRSLREKIWL